jgi:Citrate synthase, C-terminal domain
MQAARAVEKAFADAKKSLPINVDGAIGAILADPGVDLAAFNGIFMTARRPGLVAHVIEEQTARETDAPYRSSQSWLRRASGQKSVILVHDTTFSGAADEVKALIYQAFSPTIDIPTNLHQ